MRLTALDIREQQFRRVMRGFDPDEVVTFLDTVAAEYEQLVSENRDLRQRLLDLEHQLAEFKNMEKALRDTLMTAERVTAETRENAQREAALILREAEVTAQQATAGISSEILQKRRELSELQRRKNDYLLSVRSLAQSHLEMIDSANRALDAEASFSAEALDARRRDVASAPVPDPHEVSPPPAGPMPTPHPGGAPQEARPQRAAAPGTGAAAASSPLPSEVGGVIPSAVPQAAGPPMWTSADHADAGDQPHAGWAEASFEPGDLVPRAERGPRSAREAEHYRRGITPNDPLPSLLRASGQDVSLPARFPEQASTPDEAATQDASTHTVRPDRGHRD